MQRKELPEKDELVVCTVKEVRAFGTFVTLDEYEGREGLIHISEIASGWVKHIRDYVKEGQKVVCKVLNVNKEKGHLDLSLRLIKAAQRREKIKQFEKEKKAKKCLYLAASSAGMSKEEMEGIEMKLLDAYGNLYDAFEDFVKKGIKEITSLLIDEKYASEIHKIAVANIKLPIVRITGYAELRSYLPNGVEIIKEALKKAKETKIKCQTDENNTIIEISYLGVPKYRISVTASNYKEAESALNEAANAAIEVVKGSGGYGKFSRR